MKALNVAKQTQREIRKLAKQYSHQASDCAGMASYYQACARCAKEESAHYAKNDPEIAKEKSKAASEYTSMASQYEAEAKQYEQAYKQAIDAYNKYENDIYEYEAQADIGWDADDNKQLNKDLIRLAAFIGLILLVVVGACIGQVNLPIGNA